MFCPIPDLVKADCFIENSANFQVNNVNENEDIIL